MRDNNSVPKTLELQSQLPSLPLPSLEKTCAKYLESGKFLFILIFSVHGPKVAMFLVPYLTFICKKKFLYPHGPPASSLCVYKFFHQNVSS